MMYAFAQRSDTKVVDEPFYACYLKYSGANHPGREEILHSMPSNPAEVLESFSKLRKKHKILFLKNMAHHHIGLDRSYLKEMKNVFLIRNPKQLIASFARVIPDPAPADIGLKEEAELFDFVEENGEYASVVIDSNDFLADPKMGLSKLCSRLEISFDPSMLQWEAEPIPEDGVWAEYWYKNVHNSTGFAKQKISKHPLPVHCEPLLKEVLPYYEKLKQYNI